MWPVEEKLFSLFRASSSVSNLFFSVKINGTPPDVLTFKQACNYMQKDSKILFVGDIDTACSYHYDGNTMYTVELNSTPKIMNGLESHKFLCELETEFSAIVYKDQSTNEWHRRSVAEIDYSVFTSLSEKVDDTYHGIEFKGFKNFRDETILFPRIECISEIKIYKNADEECEKILSKRLKLCESEKQPVAKKARRITPIPVQKDGL